MEQDLLTALRRTALGRSFKANDLLELAGYQSKIDHLGTTGAAIKSVLLALPFIYVVRSSLHSLQYKVIGPIPTDFDWSAAAKGVIGYLDKITEPKY